MKITGVIITFISIFFTLIIGCSNEDDIIGKDLIDSDLYDVNSISFPNENYNILSLYYNVNLYFCTGVRINL